MGILRDTLTLFSGGVEQKLATQMLFDKVIGFKGVTAGAGATTLLYNIAVMLSQRTMFRVAVVDTSMEFPCLFTLLGASLDDTAKGDIFDYAGGKDLGKIMYGTRYSNIFVTGFVNRDITHMVSMLDDLSLCDKLIDDLKNYYDIILLDISQEHTQISTEACIRCNKIYMVADYSLKCVSNFYKSYNAMAMLGVSMSTCRRVILNKTEQGLPVKVKDIFDALGLTSLGEIPNSRVIARQGIVGKPVYGMSSVDGTVTQAHLVFENVFNDIVSKTPLTEPYIIKEGEEENPDIHLDEDIESMSTPVENALVNTGVEKAKMRTEVVSPDFGDNTEYVEEEQEG